ncbi:hypothetical protein Peur_015380 [Populus x canadensis]
MVILVSESWLEDTKFVRFLRTRFMSSGNEARFIPANVFPAPRNFIMQRELCPAMLKMDMNEGWGRKGSGFSGSDDVECRKLKGFFVVQVENGHTVVRHAPYQPRSLPWLDLRVFYVRVSKCEIDGSTPERLSVNHISLYPDTLLEVNGVRTSINSSGASTTLGRDRLDKKSEEAIFVSTDNIRMTGSVKFEVFEKDVLMLSGAVDFLLFSFLIACFIHGKHKIV